MVGGAVHCALYELIPRDHRGDVGVWMDSAQLHDGRGGLNEFAFDFSAAVSSSLVRNPSLYIVFPASECSPASNHDACIPWNGCVPSLEEFVE